MLCWKTGDGKYSERGQTFPPIVAMAALAIAATPLKQSLRQESLARRAFTANSAANTLVHRAGSLDKRQPHLAVDSSLGSGCVSARHNKLTTVRARVEASTEDLPTLSRIADLIQLIEGTDGRIRTSDHRPPSRSSSSPGQRGVAHERSFDLACLRCAPDDAGVCQVEREVVGRPQIWADRLII